MSCTLQWSIVRLARTDVRDVRRAAIRTAEWALLAEPKSFPAQPPCSSLAPPNHTPPGLNVGDPEPLPPGRLCLYTFLQPCRLRTNPAPLSNLPILPKCTATSQTPLTSQIAQTASMKTKIFIAVSLLPLCLPGRRPRPLPLCRQAPPPLRPSSEAASERFQQE